VCDFVKRLGEANIDLSGLGTNSPAGTTLACASVAPVERPRPGRSFSRYAIPQME
jgi:hypothetical protein